MPKHLTYANVMATLAVFIALGGTAYAVNTVGSSDVIDESLRSQDIKNGEVKVADIGQQAVATDELANGQVKAADIGDGEVRAADIANGQVTADELAANSVRSDEVADGQVRSQEIANGQVQAQDLAPGVAPGASGARAWGLVSSLGQLLRSKQVSSVINPDEGSYCIDPAPGIDPTTAVMLVGENFAANDTTELEEDISHVEWNSNPFNCPSGTMQVVTHVGDGSSSSGGELDVGGFDLELGDQGFSFVIP